MSPHIRRWVATPHAALALPLALGSGVALQSQPDSAHAETAVAGWGGERPWSSEEVGAQITVSRPHVIISKFGPGADPGWSLGAATCRQRCPPGRNAEDAPLSALKGRVAVIC